MTQDSIKQYIAKFHPECDSSSIITIIEYTPIWNDRLFIDLYIMSLEKVADSNMPGSGLVNIDKFASRGKGIINSAIKPIQLAMDKKRPIRFINHLQCLGYDLTITRLDHVADKHFVHALLNLDVEAEVILGLPDILYYRNDVQICFKDSDCDVELLHCPDGDIKKLYTRVKRLVINHGFVFLPADYTKVKYMTNTTSDDLHNFAPLIHHSFKTIVQLPKIQLLELLKQIVNQLEYL